MRNPDNRRTLPSYKLGFRQNRYAIDAQRQLVIPIDQPQLQIDVSSVPINDGVIAFVFDDVAGKILNYDPSGDPNFRQFTHLQIPALGLLDPEGARLAWEWELIRRDVRKETVLSTIDFAGTRFIVDAARYEFRQLDDPSNKIPMSDLEGSNPEYDRANVKRIQLPTITELDPIGLARKEGRHDAYYMDISIAHLARDPELNYKEGRVL